MTSTSRSWLLAALLMAPLPSLAGPDDFEIADEDDDIVFDDDETESSDDDRPDREDDLTVDENEDDLEGFEDPVGGEEPVEGEEPPAPTDLLGDDPTANQTLGADTETVYRQTNARLSRLPADEELLGWEEYLATYPNSVFRARIQGRMLELETELYETPTRRPGSGDVQVDALNQQLDFAHAMQLNQLNPRTRLQVGFEWGLTDYMNLFADYEKAFSQRISAHAGIRRRYSGFGLELGPRFALVKSQRTQTIVSVWPDIHVNLNPAFPAFAPKIGAGKRFGKLDAQLQGGVDLEIRSESDGAAGTTTKLRTRYSGGVSLYYAASDTVGFFGETYLNLRPVEADGAFDGGTFTFHVVSFGLKFFPTLKNRPGERPIEVNTGATVPVAQNYWQYHYGSIMGQMNYYLED